MAHNILIVDDSATTRAMVKRIVKLCGVPTGTLYEAPDGKDALEVLAKNHIDLVLADLHMPIMGGLEMTERMQTDPVLKNIPVVVISADPNVSRPGQLKQLGVVGHLIKPFTPENLRNVLGKILGVPNAA